MCIPYRNSLLLFTVRASLTLSELDSRRLCVETLKRKEAEMERKSKKK
jgi:hypothetical protein